MQQSFAFGQARPRNTGKRSSRIGIRRPLSPRESAALNLGKPPPRPDDPAPPPPTGGASRPVEPAPPPPGSAGLLRNSNGKCPPLPPRSGSSSPTAQLSPRRSPLHSPRSPKLPPRNRPSAGSSGTSSSPASSAFTASLEEAIAKGGVPVLPVLNRVSNSGSSMRRPLSGSGFVVPPRSTSSSSSYASGSSSSRISTSQSAATSPRKILTQRHKSTPLASLRRSGSGDENFQSKRKKVALETMETEKTYVQSLEKIATTLVAPLRKMGNILNQNELFDIFSNWEVLLGQHQKLLVKIEERVSQWDEKPMLGDIFVENTKFIKLYKHYVNNFDNSITKLETYRQHPQKKPFAEYLDTLEYSEQLNGLNLNAFLILPVQRIPRYVLLLQDMLKSTPEYDEDYGNLMEALSTMKDMADYINENKSNADAIKTLVDLSAKFVKLPTENLVVPGRVFVLDGLMKTGKEKVQVFLFSDCLICAKPTGKKYKYKSTINLATASLNTNIPVQDKHHFEIRSVAGNFRFALDNVGDKDEWISKISETLENCQKSMINEAFAGNRVSSGGQQMDGSKQFQQHRAEENFQKRTELIHKIMEEETAYIQTLDTIYETFLVPMKNLPEAVISSTEIKPIFLNFEQIREIHHKLFSALSRMYEDWNVNSCVGQVFLDNSSWICGMYEMYLKGHESSKAAVEKTLNNSMNFSMFLMELESREKKNLVDLLAVPLRKMSSYYLHLQELQNYVSSKHEDYDSIREAVAEYKKTNEILEAVNLKKKASSSGISLASSSTSSNKIGRRKSSGVGDRSPRSPSSKSLRKSGRKW